MRARLRRLLTPSTVLIGFVIFSGGVALTFRVTSTPSSCATCHEMRPVVASFRASTHASMGCMGCHTDPGQINFVKAKIRDGAKDVYGHVFGYQQPIRSHVPELRCLTCHTTILQRNTFRQLEVAHDKHRAQGIACVKCHLRVGHQTLTLSASDRIRSVGATVQQSHRQVTLDTCFASGCHDGSRAAEAANARTACATCHLDQQRMKPASHVPDFLQTHGRAARAQPRDCLTCHRTETTLASFMTGATNDHAAYERLSGSKFCTQCHATQNPHPPEFERIHGREARTPDADCATCHRNSQQFCDACHGVQMPHPAGYRERHGPAARKMAAKCAQCHEQKQCEGCHHATRPKTHSASFRAQHGGSAKARPENCALCHRKSTCDSCHVLPMPHPAKYAANHTVDASRRESACANCHKKADCLKCHENDEVHIPNVQRPYGAGEKQGLVQLFGEWLQERAVCPAAPQSAGSSIASAGYRDAPGSEVLSVPLVR